MSGENDFSNVTSLLVFKAISINISINDVTIIPEILTAQTITIPTIYENLGGAFIPDRYIPPKGPVPQIKVEHRHNDSIDGVNDSTQKMHLSNAMENLTTEQTRICGLPGFCSKSAYDTCYNTTLRNCSECTGAASLAFISFVVCLGFAIFVGNSLILTVGYKRHKKGKESKLDICRSSLVLADILTG